MLKKTLIGLGLLIVVLVIAAVAIVNLVDVNRFKPQIERFVQDRYQRTLRFDGDLGVDLFPKLALSLPRATLSEHAGPGEVASIAKARVGVAVLPLLRGEIVADKVTVEGLKARIERRKDGSLSIDDLIGTKAPPPASDRPAPPAEPSTALPRFDIGGLAVTGGQVVFEDQQAGRTVTVERLDLDTGRVANKSETPISLKLAFAGTAPAARGSLTLKGAANLDLDNRVYGASNVDAVLEATMQLAEGRELQASTVASRLNGTADAMTLDRLAIDATTKKGAGVVQLKLATPVRASVQAGTLDMSALAGSIVVTDPSLPQKTASMEITGTVAANNEQETLQAELNGKGEGSALVAKVQAKGFGQPKVAFEVTADQFDVDRFFPARAAPGSSGAGSSGAGAPSGAGSGSATSGTPTADAPIDLSALADLDLSGSLAVGRLQARGLTVSDLQVKVKAAQGRLDAAPITAALYGGKLNGTSAIRAGATPDANRIDADVDLTGVSIGPLLRDVARQDLLEGSGNLKLVLNTGGGTVDAMKRGLDGSARLALRNGAIKGINLAETIRSARNLLRSGKSESKASDASKKTDFTELDVSFKIVDGVATSSDLDVKSPLLRIGGEGRVDLVASRVDYTVRASVVGTSTGQDGKDLAELRGVTLPVRLTGPFDQVDWQIDWETAGREALKSRAAAELRDRLKTDDLEGKAREKLGDALKGLFKR
jgi:AsmA protein